MILRCQFRKLCGCHPVRDRRMKSRVPAGKSLNIAILTGLSQQIRQAFDEVHGQRTGSVSTDDK